MTDTTRPELLMEIARAARGLGAKSDLLGLIGSWGDTLSNEDVLEGLKKWNRLHPLRPNQGGLSPGEAETINALLAKLPAGPSMEPEPEAALEHAIQDEIYLAFKWLGAPAELLAPLNSWGDTYSDQKALADIRRFNRTGSMFDDVGAALDDLPHQDNEPR